MFRQQLSEQMLFYSMLHRQFGISSNIWILALGVWNDNGIWIDEDIWID